MGVAREEAENGPQAHAITKWLGRDSPDFSPMTARCRVAAPGWLLVCSDGLWNYASEADALQALIADLSQADADPLPLAESLVQLGQRARAARTTSPSPCATVSAAPLSMSAALSDRHTEPTRDSKGS